MKNGKVKKIISITLIAALIMAAIGGIAFAVKKTTSGGKVTVIEASNFNNAGWYGSENSMEGIVMSENTQDVYVTEADTISEVLVSEGTQVRKGDVLVKYDKTKTSLALQRQQLAYDKLILEKEVAERNLTTLSKMVPYVEPIYVDPGFPEDDGMDEPDDIEDEGMAGIYGKQGAKEKLATIGDAYNNSDADGTAENPYRFLCKDGTEINSDFVKAVEGKYVVFERRVGDQLSGDLLQMFYKNANDIKGPTDKWTGTINFLKGDKPEIIIGESSSDDVEALKKEIEDLKKKLEEAQKDSGTEDLNKKIEEKDKEIAQLKEELKKAQEGGSSSGDDSDKVKELEEKLKQAEADKAAAEDEKNAAEQAKADAEAAKTEIEKQLQEKQNALDELQAKYDDLNNK